MGQPKSFATGRATRALRAQRLQNPPVQQRILMYATSDSACAVYATFELMCAILGLVSIAISVLGIVLVLDPPSRVSLSFCFVSILWSLSLFNIAFTIITFHSDLCLQRPLAFNATTACTDVRLSSSTATFTSPPLYYYNHCYADHNAPRFISRFVSTTRLAFRVPACLFLLTAAHV